MNQSGGVPVELHKATSWERPTWGRHFVTVAVLAWQMSWTLSAALVIAFTAIVVAGLSLCHGRSRILAVVVGAVAAGSSRSGQGKGAKGVDVPISAPGLQ